MPSPYLSKSDFKACFDCRTRLFYRKNSYPSNSEENEYLQFLADGGFMIETVAKAQYPRGIDLAAERDPLVALTKTQALINASDDAVVFEAAAVAGKYQARIDILRREGRVLHLIEVKSSSIRVDDENEADSPFLVTKGKNAGQVSTKWKPYLLDVAFQAWVLRQAFPTFQVVPWLCVVNKSHIATAAETLVHFTLRRDPNQARARPEVTYAGNASALIGSKLLTTRNVTHETELLMLGVKDKAETLAALIDARGNVQRVQEDVAENYSECRTCEYRFRGPIVPERHGFGECWGDMAHARPHLLDLHRVTQIGSDQFPDPVPGLLAARKASLLDLNAAQLGKEGSRQRRREIQWSNSRVDGTEHLPRALQHELKSHLTDPGYPVHFVDFEACNVALPHHAGLRPYDRVAFQWSCHSIDEQGRLNHAEWLNSGRDFPNFSFARSLRQQIGDKGCIYVWSHYEQSTLKRVLAQMEEWVKRDPVEALRVSGLSDQRELEELADWINGLLGAEDAKGKRHDSPRIRDLHALALRHYFHPEMLGRTSIKVVLPAIWRHDPALQQHPWFSEYLKHDASGMPIDPYKTLPALPLGDEEDDEDAIVDGTGAIRVYQDLIFCAGDNAQRRENRERLLKQYCRLDTLAMIMIWNHWSA
jgi:hypothetical protein